MSGCVRNICTKNYQNLIIGFQVTAKNVGDVFFGTQCIYVFFSSTHPQVRPLKVFLCLIRQTTWFCTRKCFLGL